MRFFSRCLFIAMLFIGLTAFTSARGDDDLNLSFGVYQTDKPSEMYRQFTPVIKLLEQKLSASLGRPVRIHLAIFKTYEEANDALVAGDVDFVRFGPASYVIAKQRNPGISLLAMEHKNGEKRFEGVVIVPTDSPAQQLSDLKGKRFAFGDQNSTIGRYLVQAELLKAGLHARDLADYDYLDRHDKVVKAVALGDFDAGSVKENTFKKMNQDGKLRILHRFDNVTKPWIVRSDMDPELITHLQESLLSIETPEALESLKFSGFLPSDDDEFEFVRDGMQQSQGFFP